jgi:hypothetical protein
MSAAAALSESEPMKAPVALAANSAAHPVVTVVAGRPRPNSRVTSRHFGKHPEA